MLADILLGCLIQKRQMLLRQPHVIILKPGGDRRFPVRVLKDCELALINLNSSVGLPADAAFAA